MRVVIDTNRIMASLIRDGASRSIIFDERFEFFAPEYAIQEIYKHEDEIIEKANIYHEEFDFLFLFLFEKIKIVSKENYIPIVPHMKKLIVEKDAPFLALAVSMNADAIWSDDKHFQRQDRIRVFTTREMVEI